MSVIITKKNIIKKSTWIETDKTNNLKIGDYICISIITYNGKIKYNNDERFIVKNVGNNSIHIKGILNYKKKYGDNFVKAEWCLAKDDISPQELFDSHKVLDPIEGPKGRAKIAKYCIMDCELCIHLLLLLDFIPNNMGMASVCYVPQPYIFLRGQGIKVQSLVTKYSNDNNIRVPSLKQFNEETDDNSGFEGAIVLEPKTGLYLDDPISVVDYASLYPSSIIEKNISHETLIEDPGLLEEIGEDNYHTISYQDWIYRNKGKGDTIEKIDAGTQTTCYFMKPEYMKSKGMFQEGEKEMGIIPAVLRHLLDARKRTRGLIKQTDDEFKKKVLDGLQLAYKVTANSVYGQLGAKTSTVYKMSLAACTTSVGRSRIDDASRGVILWAEKKGYPEPEVVYGDTDSVFVKFSRYKDGRLLTGKEALKHCIECGQ